eukprot:TRINITY_DN852_c0_g2_i1.p1 TRINITY_DN852_c0_g2~~TRINITY_DN852_c0_g2_i1.p1  ORF type:complete len:222 (+),score=42.32 TRINITY_DN852_c0_g2_i1:397-1062(+)
MLHVWNKDMEPWTPLSAFAVPPPIFRQREPVEGGGVHVPLPQQQQLPFLRDPKSKEVFELLITAVNDVAEEKCGKSRNVSRNDLDECIQEAEKLLRSFEQGELPSFGKDETRQKQVQTYRDESFKKIPQVRRHAEYFTLTWLLLERATGTPIVRAWPRDVDKKVIKMKAGITRSELSSSSHASASDTEIKSLFPRLRNDKDESALVALLGRIQFAKSQKPM